MEAILDVPGPLDLARTFSRFQTWGEDPVNRLSEGVFRRAVRVGARWHGYELRWTGEADATRVTVTVPGARRPEVLAAAVAEARRICGADLDLEAFYRAAKEDAVLGELAPRLRGLRPTLMPEPFEMLVGSICAQQVNLTFAFALRAALVRRYGRALRVGGEMVYAFPEPAVKTLAGMARLSERRRVAPPMDRSADARATRAWLAGFGAQPGRLGMEELAPLLTDHGIPCVAARLAKSADDAAAVAVTEGANPARQAMLRASFEAGRDVDVDLTGR